MSCTRCQKKDKFETTDYCSICLIILGLTEEKTWRELFASIDHNDLEWVLENVDEDLYRVMYKGITGKKLS